MRRLRQPHGRPPDRRRGARRPPVPRRRHGPPAAGRGRRPRTGSPRPTCTRCAPTWPSGAATCAGCSAPGDRLVRPRQRSRDGPHPRLLRRPLGVRAAHVPDPLEPRGRGGRELLARLLAARPGLLPRDDDAAPEARPQEEPEAAPPARAVPGGHGQAVLRPRLPGADAQVRQAGPRRRALGELRPDHAAARLGGRRAGRASRPPTTVATPSAVTAGSPAGRPRRRPLPAASATEATR